MKITALKIQNYKGFSDSGFVGLDPMWNVVVGQNNAGKTAFMEGFRLARNVDKPHKNLAFPRDRPLPQRSLFVPRMTIGRQWLRNTIAKRGGQFFLPTSGHSPGIGRVDIDPLTFWEGDDLNVEITFSNTSPQAKSDWPSHGLFSYSDQPRAHALDVDEAKNIVAQAGAHVSYNDSLSDYVLGRYDEVVYFFEAKRFALGECAHQDTRVLNPDASNLPAVLSKMAGTTDLFNEYKRNVAEVFPDIKDVTVTPLNNNLEIRLWSIDPSTRRDDLAIPLNESGTGVGQVLAILYVAMTNDSGVVAIDEPNSFLHPGAAKKLIQILKRYPQNQYIISTHSPEVMGAAQPAKLHLVRSNVRGSVIETFDDLEVDAQRMMLEEVGASISDVFGADRVIWVEGPTERECFELIVSERLNGPIIGLSFVALRNTGDFEGRNADSTAVLDIYDRLSAGGSILPTTVAFSFDGEGKSQAQIDDLKRRCQGRARVLARRMTENYLLVPAAIAGVLRDLGEDAITEDIVVELLEDLAPGRLPKGSNAKYGDEEYFVAVDGAKLLEDVFHAATDARQEYRKVRDAVEILRKLLEAEGRDVDELVAYVKDLATLGEHGHV